MSTCFELHGFNVGDGGEDTTDRASSYLEQAGFNVIDVDYGHFNLIEVRTRTDAVVDHLLLMVKPGDTFFAHSHGCAIAAKAIERGAPFAAGVMVHPALRSWWTPPKGHPVRQIAVFSRLTDFATWSAFLLRIFSPGRFLWGRHFWGAMGSTGPLSNHPKLKRYKGAHGHSGGFSSVEKWGPIWRAALKEACCGKH